MAGAGDIRAGGAYVEVSTQESKFNTGLARIQARMGTFASGLRAAGSRLAVLGTAAVGGLGIALRSFSNIGSELMDMSARTGVSVEALSELGFAARMGGADLAGVEDTIKHMQRTLAEAAEGSTGAVKALNDLGLTLNQLRGLTPDKQLEIIGERLSGIRNPATRASAAMAMFSRSGTKVLAWAGNLREARARAQELGVTISKDTAAAADELGDAFDTLKMVAGRALFNIGAILAPVAMAIMDKLMGVVKVINDWIKENPRLTGLIGLLSVAAIGLGAILFSIGVLMKAVSVAAVPLIIAFKILNTGFLATRLAVGVAISSLIQLGGILTKITLLLHRADMGMVALKVFKPLRAVIFGLVFPTFRVFKARVEFLARTLLSLGTAVTRVIGFFAGLARQILTTLVSALMAAGKAILSIRLRGGLLANILAVIKGVANAAAQVILGLGRAMLVLASGAWTAAKAVGRIVAAMAKLLTGLPIAKIFSAIGSAVALLASGLFYAATGLKIVAVALFRILASAPVVGMLKLLGTSLFLLGDAFIASIRGAGILLGMLFRLMSLVPLRDILSKMGQVLIILGSAMLSTGKAALQFGMILGAALLAGTIAAARGLASLTAALVRFTVAAASTAWGVISSGLKILTSSLYSAAKGFSAFIVKAYAAIDALMRIKIPLLHIPNIVVRMPQFVAPPMNELKRLFMRLVKDIVIVAKVAWSLVVVFAKFAAVAVPMIVRGLIASLPILKSVIVATASAMWVAIRAAGRLALILATMSAQGAIAGLKVLGAGVRFLAISLASGVRSAILFAGSLIRMVAASAASAAMVVLRGAITGAIAGFWLAVAGVKALTVALWAMLKAVVANFILPTLGLILRGLVGAFASAKAAVLGFNAAMLVLWNARRTSLYFNIVRKQVMGLLSPFGLLARAVAIMAGYAIWFPPAAVGGGFLILGQLRMIAGVIPTLFRGMGEMLGRVFRIALASLGALMDALMAGDFEMAWAVTCAMMKAAWTEVIAWLTERWSKFSGVFHDIFGFTFNDMWAAMKTGFVNTWAIVQTMWVSFCTRLKNIWVGMLGYLGRATVWIMGHAQGLSEDVIRVSMQQETGHVANMPAWARSWIPNTAADTPDTTEAQHAEIGRARVAANRRIEEARQLANERAAQGLPVREANQAVADAMWELEAVLNEAANREAARQARQRAGQEAAGDDTMATREVTAKGTFSAIAAAGMGGASGIPMQQLNAAQQANQILQNLLNQQINAVNAIRGIEGVQFA